MASRFFVSVENLGLLSSLKLFSIYHFGITRDSVLFARKLDRPLHFRGAADGVLSHFFYPGVRVRDTPEKSIRFIIDAGANIGDETLRFRHFHPDAHIVALEPDTGNYRMLLRNVAGDKKITPLQVGLWSHSCRLSVLPGIDNNNEAFRVCETPPGQTGDIPAISVPDLIERFGCPEIDILKMDIEGAEHQVFAHNAVEWLDRVKVFIFECPDNDHPGATIRIFRAIGDRKFNCYIQGENLVLIRQDTGWTVEANLFLPDRAVSDRIGFLQSTGN